MNALYEADFYGWALEQARAVRAAGAARINTPAAIDWENVAEELEGLARTEAKELRSRYATLILHLLKWQHQPQGRGASWEFSIRRERDEIPDHLAESPSLKPHQGELFAKAYRPARYEAASETGIPLAAFPATCPFTLEQAMDEGFWPE
jgi:hypothetical protein